MAHGLFAPLRRNLDPAPRRAPPIHPCQLFYWRDGNREVDFVTRAGRAVTAIEVKSGRRREARPGLAAFSETQGRVRTLLVGGDGIAVEEFLTRPVEHWVKG